MASPLSSLSCMEEDDPAACFSWPEYLECRGSAAAIGGSSGLFPHLAVLHGRLAERVIRPGHILLARRGRDLENGQEGTLSPAEVEVVCGDWVFVRLVACGPPCREWIPLQDLAPCPDARAIAQRLIVEDESSSDEGDSSKGDQRSRRNRKREKMELNHPGEKELALAMLTSNEILAVGQFLELQRADSPDLVDIGEIISNRGGLLTVRCGSRVESVFVTDERCHRIGWTASGVQDCSLSATSEDMIAAAAANPAPSELFESFVVREHRFEVRFSHSEEDVFEVGMRLEALDPSRDGIFSPATVSRSINRHYVVVKVDGSDRTLICHRASPFIFPMYWCQRNGLRLAPPQGYECEEFSWATYKTQREEEEAVEGSSIAARSSAGDHCFEMLRVPQRRVDLRRQLEVFKSEEGKMYPATIVRSFRQLIWIHFDHHENATPPVIYSIRSNHLFPCGFAQKHGVPLIAPQRPKKIVKTTNLSKLYTSVRPPIFVPSLRHYLPRHWLKDNRWAPAVFVHVSCFCGPFLLEDRVRSLPVCFGPGPLPLVLHSVLASLICCAHRPKDFAEMIACSKDSALPCVHVKARMKLRRYRVRVETCDRVTQLPYWLMSFLTQIDACPGLLSLDEPGQSASCQWSCVDNLAALPYMHSQQHTNTANYFNPTIKLVPKRFRRALVAVAAPDAASTVLSPLIAAARRRRDRQSTTATIVARRPVTRGVRLPRYDHLQSPIRGNHRILTPTIPLVKVKLESGMVATSPENAPPACPPPPSYCIPSVASNPSRWSCEQLIRWLAGTDSALVSERLKAEEVDGEAFMLLTLQDCLQYLGLKLGPALKLAAVIQELKIVFLTRFDEAPLITAFDNRAFHRP